MKNENCSKLTAINLSLFFCFVHFLGLNEIKILNLFGIIKLFENENKKLFITTFNFVLISERNP